MPSRNLPRSAASVLVLLILGSIPRWTAPLAAQAPARAAISATAMVAQPARLIGGAAPVQSPLALSDRWVRRGFHHVRAVLPPRRWSEDRARRIEVADLST